MIRASSLHRCFAVVPVLTASLLLLNSCATMQREAATDRVHRVAIISPTSRTPMMDVLRRNLAEQGYVEGRNLVLDEHYAEGKLERLPEIAARAIERKPDVIFTATGIGTQAAHKATTTIPIVFAGVFDPRTLGVVSDLDRPGGNVTGAAMDLAGTNLVADWVRLLQEASPGVNHIAVLSAKGPLTENWMRQVRAAASETKVKLDVLDASDAAALEKALATISASDARAMIVLPDPFFTPNREKLGRFASDRRLPSMTFFKLFVDAGGLMSYGASQEESYRKGAQYVARILQGAKPGDIPVHRQTRGELVINNKVAKGMGVMIPQPMLKRANAVIDDPAAAQTPRY